MSSNALAKVLYGAHLNDVLDYSVTLLRNQTANRTLDKLHGMRTVELRDLWTYAEENRALDSALQNAQPGQFLSVREKIASVNRATDLAYARSRQLVGFVS